jgi:hypothetical protein
LAGKFQNISNLGLINDVITKNNSRPNSVTKYIHLVRLSTTTAQCQTHGKEHEMSQPFSSTPLNRSYLISKYISPRYILILPSNFIRGFPRNLPWGKKKGKADPLQAWSGPEGSRKLRFPDFMKTAQNSGKVVSLTHRPPLPQEIHQVLISVRG